DPSRCTGAPSPATSVDPSRQSRRRPYGSSRRAPPPATTTDAPDLHPLPVSPAPSVRPHSNPCAIAPLRPSQPRRITSTSNAMQPQGTAAGNPEPESHSTKIGIRLVGRAEFRRQNFEIAPPQNARQKLGKPLRGASEAGHSHFRERLGQRF